MMLTPRIVRTVAVAVVGLTSLVAAPLVARADTNPSAVPFTQDWSAPGLFGANHDWSRVPSIIGYRGDEMTSPAPPGVDPQTVVADGATSPVNLLVGSSAASGTGGIHQIDAAGAVALQGSGTADAPHLVIRLDTTGASGIVVAYDLVDLDAQDTTQPVALQYRVGGSGDYVNVPAGYVADASDGNGLVSHVSAVLPSAADGQPIVDVRIITTDAPSSDSMTAVDDISITDGGVLPPAEPIATCPATLTTTEGTPTSAAVSATDADSSIASIAITSTPVDGITLTPSGVGTATLDIADDVAIGTYPTEITFSTDDDPAQTATCTVEVAVTAVPGDAFIHDVQGSGAATPIDGQVVTIEGVATSLFTSQDVLDGFFVQEEDADADADPATSEGIYVFCRDACLAELATGDLVSVTGTAGEFQGVTQLTARDPGTTSILASGVDLPTPATVDLPAADSTRNEPTFETTEAMLVTIPQTLAVSEYFELARFGSIVLTEGERPEQFTDANAPSVAGYDAAQADLATRRIILDDDNNDQNDAISNGPDEPYPWPVGGLDITNRFRGGETITGLTGVMHWSWAGSGANMWRLRPVADASVDYDFAPAETSADLEDVGGDVRVASFNVLNYFETIDETSSSSSGPCGPLGDMDCRGADSIDELDVQREKIVAAVSEIDADVVGLIEIQNDTGASTQALVNALNAEGTGTYASIDTGFIGGDAIKVALIYQPATVTPVGDFAILDSSVDPTFLDDRNRPALVQTFEENATGERFTVAVNHFKSKGSACTGDPDLLDGAGNCNVTRTDAANALANFLAGDPTGSGDPDFLIIGDLNSYRMEDPITALQAAGYTDLVAQFEGDDAYSYVFDGQLGYLDHALANDSLVPQVAGVTTWHINADEVPLFDYNDAVATTGEASFDRESAANDLTDTSELRSSDHDPVVIGLDLGAADDQPLRLTLLHNNDGESALLPSTNIGGIARYATIVNDLRAEAATEPGNADSLLVSSGDNYLAGPQLQASLDNYDGDTDYSDDGPFYDALALDYLDYDASAVGNHEFDFGPGALGYFMSQFDTSNIRFVSANLDVTGDAALAQFVASPPGEAGTLVEWTRTEAGGRSVAIVGATTPRLPSISSPGPDVVVDDDVLAAVQTAIDESTADGTEIVILISHLQNIAEDQALIAELSGLDIAVAGGGDELLANADDPLLPGTDAAAIFGPYPIIEEAADGADVPIVTTQGSYGYVGRLIVDIDADGVVTAVDDRSGPVRNPFNATTPPADQAEPDPWVLVNVEEPVAEYVAGLGGDVIAFTEPALDGVTANVRTGETNLGSFFADALRETAELSSPDFGATNPTVAIQNSGGIRNSVVLGPNADVTTLDTFTIAPFTNFVAYLTDVSPEQLKELMERSVSANVTAGALQAEGRFGQISGMEVVYDPTQTAQVVVRNADGTVDITTPGERVRQLKLTLNDDDPSNDIVVVLNGEVVAGAPNVDLAANSFTIQNGDNYPFNVSEGEFVNLASTYQQSLADKFIREGVVTTAAYPEGGLGRITVGGDVVVPPDDTLRIDSGHLFFPPRFFGGTALVTGGIEPTLDDCPELALSIDGTEIIDVRTFRLFGTCIGLSRDGLVTFHLDDSDFTVAGSLPRNFSVADPDVDFVLTVDGDVFEASVEGILRGRSWTAT